MSARHLAGCDTRGGNWICAAGCPVAAQRTEKETTMPEPIAEKGLPPLAVETHCIGCGHPNPTGLHIAGCTEAQRKLREPVRFPSVAAPERRAVAREVAQFNDLIPVGTPVLYWAGLREGEGVASKTRTRAWLLGDHTPVVMVEGYPGGIALSHVCPIPPAESKADQ